MRAGSGAPLRLPLAGLASGSQVVVDLLTDDGANGSATVHRTVRASTGDTLEVPTANNGGFVAVVCAATGNRTSCLEPVEARPDVTLTVDPVQADVEPGSTFELRTTFSVADREVTRVELTPDLPAGWSADRGTQTVARLRRRADRAGHVAGPGPRRRRHGHVRGAGRRRLPGPGRRRERPATPPRARRRSG